MKIRKGKIKPRESISILPYQEPSTITICSSGTYVVTPSEITKMKLKIDKRKLVAYKK
jgi:hypothetical protein